MHFLGADTLYGRYWGCLADIPYLHFELCYYRAVDIAIERGLARVEAGAQGGHKLARGYGPVATWSAHYIADPGFRRAVAEFLERERQAEAQVMVRSEEQTAELQPLMRIQYAVFCLKKKRTICRDKM